MQEEELKNKVAKEYFNRFDTTRIIGKIDFCVSEQVMGKDYNLLWAEAKKGSVQDINTSFVQLILTIGRAKTFSSEIPPTFLGAFDQEKIAFIEYTEILPVFSQNDFNWNVPPSDHTTKEFVQLYDMVSKSLVEKSLLFRFSSDSDLRKFIANNFAVGLSKVNKIQIDKNNFIGIFNDWLKSVLPTILVKESEWESFKKKKLIIAGDFYLADLMSDGNKTITEKLRVLLESTHYKLRVPASVTEDDFFRDSYKDIYFKDKQKAHTAFWNIYERPPKDQYQDYILDRRDLLVPQDIRERKGSYYTPEKWVKLSQLYIAKALGDDWQDEYYVWDCCAGTGNLLVGLSDKYKIFASTLDDGDVDVMRERISNGANLLESNIFQFDFLNDSFDSPKVPQKLKEIIRDPEKRKKLVIYINPPYAEAGNKKKMSGLGEHKENVSIDNSTYDNYKNELGQATNELFAQFIYRIYIEINGCILGEFSKLKIIQAPNFEQMRKNYLAQFIYGFIVPGDTFDNVKGKFPIGFKIWNTGVKEKIEQCNIDVYDANGWLLKSKIIRKENRENIITNWIKRHIDKNSNKETGYISFTSCTFHNKIFCLFLMELLKRIIILHIF